MNEDYEVEYASEQNDYDLGLSESGQFGRYGNDCELEIEEVDINRNTNGKRFKHGVKGFVHLEKYQTFVDVRSLR